MTAAHGFASASEPVVHFGLGEASNVGELTVTWPSGAIQSFENLDGDKVYTIVEPPAGLPMNPKPEKRSLWFVRSQGFHPHKHTEPRYDDFARQPLLPAKLSQLGPCLASGDIDGDGDPDLFVGGATGQPGQLYRNDGSGNFSDIPDWMPAADAVHEDSGAAFFDADADGDQDLYIASGGVECDPGGAVLRDRLYLNNGSGAFVRADATLPDLRDSGSCVAPADFDRDGDLDLFIGSRSIPGRYPETPNSALLSNEAGIFRDVSPQDLRKTGLVTDAVWSDVDDDGWLDLFVAHEWGPIKLWKNIEGKLVDSTGVAGLDPFTGWWNSIAAGDFDNDGDPDYAVGNVGLNTKYRASPEKPLLLYYGDCDGSGSKHIIEAAFEGDTLYPVRGRSCSVHAMPGLARRFGTFRDFAIADLAAVYPAQRLSQALRLEVKVLESGILMNDGTGRFTFSPLPRMAQVSPACGIAVTDANGDGNLDLYLVQNFFGPQLETGRMDGGISLLLTGDGAGNFDPVWPDESGLIVPGDATDLEVADFDGNGAPDFIIGVNDDVPLLFLRNE